MSQIINGYLLYVIKYYAIMPNVLINLISKFINNSKLWIEYRMDLISKFDDNLIGNDIIFIIPIKKSIDICFMNTNIGCIEYLKDENCIKWKIQKLKGKKQNYSFINFGCNFVNDKIFGNINVKFQIPNLSISSIKVRCIEVFEKKRYKTYSSIKYITKNGNYCIKTI